MALETRWAWGLAGLMAIYLFVVTLTWHLPDFRGVPYPPVWAVCSGLLLAERRLVRGRLEPVEAIAIMALVAMLLTDLTVFWSQGLRDLGLDLKAGARFADGHPVYMQHVMTQRPGDLTDYPFLYPPPTLPLYAPLSRLPTLVADCLQVAIALAASIGGLRLLGLDLRWSVVMLIWPPFQQGIFVGNVAAPLFIFFAAAPWLPAGLALPPLFKVQSGLTALWLVRERKWRALLLGAVLLLVLAAVTLPIVGIGQWRAYFDGLELYRISQNALPEYLYGFGLPRFVPYPIFVAIAAIAVLVALAGRGRDGLTRLGVATVVASPSLFVHGLLFALPALLSLRQIWFWVAMGITASAPGLGWWLAIGLLAAGLFVPALRRPTGPAAPREPLHPLPPEREPWPGAPFELS